MPQRTIGGHAVSAIGLGGMPLSIEGRPDEDRSIATVHAALDAGVTFIDTADAYHREADEVGHNEESIARALHEYGSGADGVLVATKGGHLRPGDGAWTPNGDPAYLKRAAKESAPVWVSTRSACISSTAPTRPCRTPTRWARSAISSTRA